jgi:hypothetical protein
VLRTLLLLTVSTAGCVVLGDKPLQSIEVLCDVFNVISPEHNSVSLQRHFADSYQRCSCLRKLRIERVYRHVKRKRRRKVSSPIAMFLMWRAPYRCCVTWQLQHSTSDLTGCRSDREILFGVNFVWGLERENTKIKSNSRSAGGSLGQVQSRTEECDAAVAGVSSHICNKGVIWRWNTQLLCFYSH